MMTFPPILLAIAIMGALGPNISNVIIALALINVPIFTRLARGATLSVVAEDYITAAQGIGAGHLRITLQHVLPNILGPLMVQATASFSMAIIQEATLSFLGLGTQPPWPSWGLMLSIGRRYLEQAWWLTVAPAFAITLTVMEINFIGDGLRDVLDPQYRGR
jgi:peptide/nickel transport system permease protein